MPQQFSNNARSTLASSINDSATSLTIQSGAADLFPVADVGAESLPSADDWFKATIQDVSGNVEIIYVRTRTSGSAVFSNVIRGQEGTTARSFVSGAIIGLRVTAADLAASIGIPDADNTFSGENTFLQPIIGDLTGDVTGDLTGNADTVTDGVYTSGNQTIAGVKTFSGTIGIGAGWTVTQTSTDLVFSYSGTAKMKLSSAGDLTVVGDVTAYGTV
jgi:hypothetical protein